MKQIRKSLVLILALLMLAVSPAVLKGSHTVSAAQTGWVRKGSNLYYYDAYDIALRNAAKRLNATNK